MWPLCVGLYWLVALGLTGRDYAHARTITQMLRRALKRGDARVSCAQAGRYRDGIASVVWRFVSGALRGYDRDALLAPLGRHNADRRASIHSGVH